MPSPALRAEGLTKRFSSHPRRGRAHADRPARRGLRLPRARTGRASRRRSACCSGCSGRPAARPGCSATRSATSSARTGTWPTSPPTSPCGRRFTGQECLDLLAGVGPGTDLAYRDELVERFELGPIGKRARTYSTGNRQKVALVAAFATRAPLLVLDEPTSGLDPLMEREFRRCIGEAAERGQTVFLSSHQLAEVEAVCDAGRHPARRAARRGRRHGRPAPAAPHRGRRRPRPARPGAATAWPTCPGSPTCAGRRTCGSRCRSPARPDRSCARWARPTSLRLDVREPSLEEIFLDYYGEVPA